MKLKCIFIVGLLHLSAYLFAQEAIYDISNLSEEESYSVLTQELFDDLAAEYPQGVTVCLAGGQRYELQGVELFAPVTIMTATRFSEKAIVELAYNFNVSENNNISKIELKNLSIIDHEIKPKTDTNYSGTYVFNLSRSEASIDTLSIQDCDIRYKRGVIRIKTTATVKNIFINKCFVDSIDAYGVVNLDNLGIVNERIVLSNSTFTHVNGYIVRGSKPEVSPKQLIVDHVTTCNSVRASRFLFDFDEHIFEEGIHISNSIFGQGYIGNAIRGLRSGGFGKNVNLDNIYITSDLIWDSIFDEYSGQTTLQYPLSYYDMVGTSAETFADTASNDYTVSDIRLKNHVGDPRWWGNTSGISELEMNNHVKYELNNSELIIKEDDVERIVLYSISGKLLSVSESNVIEIASKGVFVVNVELHDGKQKKLKFVKM